MNENEGYLEYRVRGDFIETFEEDTPIELIKRVRPDIIVKGGDYKPQEVVGYGLAVVRIFNYIEGYSTTKTLQDLSGG